MKRSCDLLAQHEARQHRDAVFAAVRCRDERRWDLYERLVGFVVDLEQRGQADLAENAKRLARAVGSFDWVP